jgi:hypothetical protein
MEVLNSMPGLAILGCLAICYRYFFLEDFLADFFAGFFLAATEFHPRSSLWFHDFQFRF